MRGKLFSRGAFLADCREISEKEALNALSVYTIMNPAGHRAATWTDLNGSGSGRRYSTIEEP